MGVADQAHVRDAGRISLGALGRREGEQLLGHDGVGNGPDLRLRPPRGQGGGDSGRRGEHQVRAWDDDHMSLRSAEIDAPDSPALFLDSAA